MGRWRKPQAGHVYWVGKCRGGRGCKYRPVLELPEGMKPSASASRCSEHGQYVRYEKKG